MKHRKKYFLFSIINIFLFVLSCLMVSFSWEYKIDHFCNQLIDCRKYSVNDKYAFPLVSISSKNEDYDYTKVYNAFYYNPYIPYYRCNADTQLLVPDVTDEIAITVISQPTFWSVPYTTESGDVIYRMDHSSYYLKYLSEYSSHGKDAFFYLSQSLANYICEQKGVEEADLLNQVFEFKSKSGEIKTAYISNIVVDGYGLADYQTQDKGFFVLSFLLFDPSQYMDFNAKFDIRLKVNPRGNTKVLESCLASCGRDLYTYSFFTFSKQDNKLIFNEKISDSFSNLKGQHTVLWRVIVSVSVAVFLVYEFFKIRIYKRDRMASIPSSIISLCLFAIFGIVACFIYAFYYFGLFLLIYFALDSLFIVFYSIKNKSRNKLDGFGGKHIEQNDSFVSIEI